MTGKLNRIGFDKIGLLLGSPDAGSHKNLCRAPVFRGRGKGATGRERNKPKVLADGNEVKHF
ncbi:hypothetical protein [Pararhizobium sp. PWRC1-1]|uniref:hypothetical protein n=1 Tax=Pararhizobium sp. PWRC1-1 TaxID=2804566 RepID=UPI003CF7572A